MLNKKTSKKAKRGITLISLVITIIVLLILATVAINLAVNSEGLFIKTGYAANKWNSSVATEQTTVQNLLDTAEMITSPVSKYVTDASTGREAPIPKGYVASQILGENTLADGLVIYEGTEEVKGTKGSAEHEEAMTTRNQYVWIPVDDITDMVMCQVCGDEGKANLDKTTLECATCTAAEKETKLAGKLYWDEDNWEFDVDDAGQTYSNDDDEDFDFYFREPDDLKNKTYGDASSTGITAITEILGDEYSGETAYAQIKEAWNEFLQNDFENMAKSVAKYGGFYISRYEVGAGGSSVKGQTVLTNSGSTNWWTLFNTLRSNPETEASVYSQMIWGSQYDQVVKFLAEDPENEPTVGHNSRGLLSIPSLSGNVQGDEMSNIFDLEGNYYEWTVDASGTNGRVIRGGYYYTVGIGDSYPVSSRHGSSPTETLDYNSSRLALMVAL